jgi:hypothetical protein
MFKTIIKATIGGLAAVLLFALVAPAAHASGSLQSRCVSAFTHARIIAACEEVQHASPGFLPTGFRHRDAMTGTDAHSTLWRFIVNARGYHKAVEANSPAA